MDRYRQAIVEAFPELPFDPAWIRGRPQMPRGHWTDLQNCRKWFCDFAKAKGFDPLVAENWYKVRAHHIKAAGVPTKNIVCLQVLTFH
jgi:hypothetical protein